MANGNDTMTFNGLWPQLLKQGSWAVIAGLFFYLFYTFTLVPLQEERVMLQKDRNDLLVMLKSSMANNKEQMCRISESMETIAVSTDQFAKALQNQAIRDEALYTLLQKFTEEVYRVHPEQTKSLKEIQETLKELREKAASSG